MQPTKELPNDYHLHKVLDFSMGQAQQLALQGAALLLFMLWGLLFSTLAGWLRPDYTPWLLLLTINRYRLGTLLALLPLTYLMVFLHEGVHGLCFWLFTQERPHFGLKRSYAYAAAPAWYLPRQAMLITGLAPLVLLTWLGVGLIPLVPLDWLPALLLMMTLNAAGAVGDLLSAAWLLRQPPDALANDQGDRLLLFRNR